MFLMKKNTCQCFCAVLLLVIPVIFVISAYGLDWPQLQNNPQRTGYQDEVMSTPVSNIWVKGFATDEEERLYPAVQAVIVNDRVYIGSEMGTFYCLDGANGNVIWRYPQAGQPRIGPILGTAGVEGGVVFFASMDGYIYALNTLDGSLKWIFPDGVGFRRGFSTSVLLAENKVFVANRDGTYYCLDQVTGNPVWETNVGANILMSSCYDNASGNGRVFFGAMDLRVYALNCSDGSIAWTSDVLIGRMFTDFWPIAYNGLVFIRLWKMVNPGGPMMPGPPNYIQLSVGPLPSEELTSQDEVITAIDNDPFQYKDMYVFDQTSGQEQSTVAQWGLMSMSNTAPIGSIDKDGYLVTVCGVGSWPAAWGKLDINPASPTFGKFVEVLYDGNAGAGNADEVLNVSCANPLVFSMHWMESNAHSVTVHAFNENTRVWSSLGNGMQYYEDLYFTGITESGGTSPASISNKYIYHVTQSNLNCRQAQ